MFFFCATNTVKKPQLLVYNLQKKYHAVKVGRVHEKKRKKYQIDEQETFVHEDWHIVKALREWVQSSIVELLPPWLHNLEASVPSIAALEQASLPFHCLLCLHRRQRMRRKRSHNLCPEFGWWV
jgi:hypothetical protein